MLQTRVHVSDRFVLGVAYVGVAVVAVCGCLGLLAGIARAVHGDRLTEGVVIAAVTTMLAVVSLAILLFLAWQVTREHAPQDTGGGPSSVRHVPLTGSVDIDGR